ncbi:MAG: leucine-rich repeat protein [Clostridia bacterium]|nr:leucine-rich repeat protein [Clostridia bacterium]
MRQTEERKELVEEINSAEKINSSPKQANQNKNERKKKSKVGLVILLVALIAVIVIAVILAGNPNACIKGQVHTDANLDLICDNCNKEMPCVEGKKHADADMNLICDNCNVKLPCKNNESHIDANLDLVCDNCKGKIPCANGEVHADVNNDLLCDNCGAGIASSDVSVYKEIENEKETLDEKNVNVRGNMPTDTKVVMNEIERSEAISLAQKYKDIESKDVIAAYDITLTDSENIKYQPADDGEKVKVTISNLNIDPSKGLAMMHIIDDENYEMIALNRATNKEIEFTTNRFSRYILVTVGTSKIEFEGLGTYNVLDSENVPIASGAEYANMTSFEFKIMPVDNYTLTNVVLKTSSGTIINPSLDGSTIFSMSDYGVGKLCKISSLTQDLKIEVTNVITLTNPIKLTALTDGAWTNKDITVEIDWPVTNFRNQIRIDDGEWQDYNAATYTMTASGTLYARVFDGDQGGGEVNVPVLNIDKIAPVVTEVKVATTEWTTGSVKVTFSATDENSGINYYYANTYQPYVTGTYYERYKISITPTVALNNVSAGNASGYCTFYVRCSDQAGNQSEIKNVTVTNIDKREPLFSNQSSYSNADFNLYKTHGTLLFSDPTFASGNNSMSIYNNYGNGNTTMTRVKIADEGIEACPVSSSGYVLKMQNKGTATPGLGGFMQSKVAAPDGIYIHRFYAKIPVGYTLQNHNNAVNGDCYWLTSKTGTGEWQEYIYMWRCKSTGEFSSFGHIALNGNVGTADNPVVWYIGYATMYDVTHIWDDIDVSYGTEKAATITIKAYDYVSGIKNITVNGVEVPLDSSSTYTNGVLTAAVAKYQVSEPGTYTIVTTDNVGKTSTMTRTAYLVSYNPNAPVGTTVTGTTVDQIKIGYYSNARYSKDSSAYSWKVTLRNNGYTNSAGTPFRGWSTSATGLPTHPAGAIHQENKGLNLYAVWNEAIQWDVSSSGNGSVIASLITNADGATYTLKISGNGAMKGWDWKNYSSAPWWNYRGSINKVIFEDGVTNVGSYAIYNMTGIKDAANIIIADSVTSFGTKSFGSCSSMKGTFKISSKVTSIGMNPVQSCTLVEAIEVDPNNTAYKSVNGVLFNKSGTTLVGYPLGNGLTHYDIPEGTVTIANEACANMRASTISIPSTLRTFNDLCFSGADLVTLSIPSTVTTFSGRPFNSLDHIQKIYYHPINLTLPHQNTFTSAKAGSVLYTANRSIAQGFIDGKDYTSSRTTLAYPPYFSTHPSNVTIGVGEQTSFSATVTDGVPSGTVTMQWQYRENDAADWKDVTSAQGTVSTSGKSSTFKTVIATADMNGYEYRCKTANGIYPGEVSQFTEEEIAGAVISKPARITIIEKNYEFAGQYFETIEAAATAFYQTSTSYSSRTGTITVCNSNVDDSEFEVKADHTITINTQIYTVTKTNNSLINNGTLIISGSGTIVTSSEESSATLPTLIQNSGTLTINGATVQHNGIETGAFYAIKNMTAASTTTVNSGNVIENGIVNDGSPSGPGYAIFSDTGSTITVNGGKVSAKSRVGIAIQAEGTSKTSIYVYGGTVESINSAVCIGSGPSLIQAEGGTLTGGRYGIYYSSGVTSTLRVNGATVSGTLGGVINYGTGETLLMSGTIDSTSAAIITGSTAPVSIKGGTIKGSTGIQNDTAAKVTIYAGTIISNNYGIHNRSTGEIRIETGSITGKTYYGVYNEGAGTINVLGGTIISEAARGIRDDGNGTINIGSEDGVISVTTPVVQGETFGVYAETGTNLNFYDGKVKGVTAPFVDGTIDDSEEGYSVFRSRDGKYIAATLQSGWDISPVGSATVTAWAVLEQDAHDMDKYKLIITGNGAMRDFTTTSMPWLGYRHLISTVDIQEGITNLGDNVMYNFESLTDLTTPNTITRIGDHAFANCKNISGTFEIPAGVTSIGVNPFANATFENITLAAGNISYVVEDRALYNVGKTQLLAYPAGNTSTDFVIPSTVTTVGQEAFASSKLVNITIPTSVRTISNDAFNGSSNVTTLLIPSSVTSIGNYAFCNLTGLKTVYLKSENSTSFGNYAFYRMASGSIIYTASYDVYTNLSGKYTTANTTVYYPPKITTQPIDQALVCPEPGEFEVVVQNGNPTGITYQWYIKEPDATDWREVTSSDGTGGTTAKFTTGYTDPEMVGTTYRCIVKSNTYPNEYFTESEISADTVSRAASLSISGGNYRVDGGLYYPTFQAALEGAGAGSHEITVIVSTVDESAPVIESNQVITLDMKNKEIEKLTAGIINNGTLTIKNGGTIETDTDASSGYKSLIENNGTFNLEGTTLRHNGDAIQGVYAIQNYGAFNMTSGAIEVKLNSAIASTATSAARGITNFEGKVNISGGSISVNYNPLDSNLIVEKETIAYAVEAWGYDGTKIGEINISGTTNISSNGKGIVLRYDGDGSLIANSKIKMTSGTVTAGEYGIWATGNAEGSIEITGGTITSDETTIRIDSTGLVPVSVSNATLTSTNGSAVHTTVANSTVTIGAGTTITAAQNGIVFGGAGTYKQTGGRITAAYDAITFGGNATINITGGTIIATARDGIYISSTATSANATISGVTITAGQKVINMNAATSLLAIENGTYRSNGSTGTNEYGIYMNAATSGTIDLGKANKTGPSITSGYVGVYLNSANGNMRMNSGSIEAKEGITTSDTLSGTITINSGTINGSSKGINTAAPVNLTINNATMTSNTCVINLAGSANATMENGTFTGLNTGITMAGSSTLTMNGGSIDTSIYGITNNGTGTLNVKAGKVFAGEIAIEHKGAAGTLTIGEDDVTEWVSKTNPEIRSILAVKASNGFNFYDGILKGIASTNEGTILDVPDKYDLYDGEETIDSKLYKTKFIAMGWDISATPGVDNVWAFLEKTATGRTLTIQGTGATKSYDYVTNFANIPWAAYHSEINEFIIQTGITDIGDRIFSNLGNVTNITIPEGVVTIGTNSFCRAEGGALKTVSIPSTVTTMGSNPFAASNIGTITIASSNANFKVENNLLLNKEGTKLIAYPIGRSDTSFTTPNGVVEIGEQAFIGSNNLEKIVIRAGVTTIGRRAFAESSKLKNVYVDSTTLNSVAAEAFIQIASDSIIYTKSKAVANKFVSGTYTAGQTSIYYPPVITSHPVSQEITNGNQVTFSVGVTAGNPVTKYTWQIKTPTSNSWVNATASDGNGYNEASFVVLATGALDGYQYRCVVSSDGYPNEEMTNAELGLTSNVATLTINAANYQVGSLYYNTLKAAVESITTTAETRIEVLLDNTEEDVVIIEATQNIVIDLNECMITGNDLAIVNKGKLTLTGEGSINAMYKESSCWLFSNRGTINVESGTYKFENKNTEDYITLGIIINENETSVTNIYGGTFEAINENQGFSTCVNAYAGEVNVFGGEINAGHYGIFNSGAFNARINLTGGNITANNSGVLLTKTNSSNTAQETNLNISGTAKIYGDKYGIWNEFSTVDLNIIGGTIEGGTHGIMNKTSKTIVGTQGETLSVISPEIIGGNYSIESTNGIYFYDGILKGKTNAYYGNITSVENDTHIMLKTPSETGTAYHSAHLEDNTEYVKSWDISKTAGTDNVLAGVKVIAGDGVNDATRYKLIITGTGATKDYTASGTTMTTTPWFSQYNSRITLLQIDNGITHFGNSLFANMTNITSIDIPDSVVGFGDLTFAGMTGLPNTFEVGKNVVSMGINPFRDIKLKTFTIETGNTAFAVDAEGVLYNKAMTRLISYPKSKTAERYEVKAAVTKVDDYAFYNASNLNKIFLKVNEANKSGIGRSGTFSGLASGSIVYTEAKEIADYFAAGITYTTANTKIYYPYKVTKMPDDIILNIGETLILEPTIRSGNPTNDVRYQWYFNGGAVNGENTTTFRKDLIVDSDSGDYQILIQSALVDDEYYYSNMSEPTNMIVRDHVGPETVSVAITYHENGMATATVTAHDSYSGVNKFYLNGTELTTGVTINSDGSGIAVFDIKRGGNYSIDVADVENNRTLVEKDAYEIAYTGASTYQTSGSMVGHILVHGYPITLRDNEFHKTGHTFVHWKTPLGATYAEGASYDEVGNAVLSAVWSVNKYTVSFYTDTGDGVKLLAQNTYNYEDIIMVPGQQVHVAEMDGTTKYKIYRHKGDWDASIVGTAGDLTPTDINASNAGSVKVIDANVRYDVVYDITTYDVGNATVYIDGNSEIKANTTANDIAIKNDEGLVIIGPLPQIYGPVQNNNGIVKQN